MVWLGIFFFPIQSMPINCSQKGENAKVNWLTVKMVISKRLSRKNNSRESVRLKKLQSRCQGAFIYITFPRVEVGLGNQGSRQVFGFFVYNGKRGENCRKCWLSCKWWQAYIIDRQQRFIWSPSRSSWDL